MTEARGYFEQLFHNQIIDLLTSFPPDSKDSSGQPFWSGPKRAPTPQVFDPTDPVHVSFVTATANLVAYTLGLKQNRDSAAIASQAKSASVPTYIQKTVKVADEESKQAEGASPEEEETLESLISQLREKKTSLTSSQFTPVEFEKDDDTNFHIEFINAAANLRARNYKIPESDHQKTKMIAGRIIPAIATTTAMITGCVTTEIYKFVQGFKEIETYKNSMINLALPFFAFSEPYPVAKKKAEFDEALQCNVKPIPDGYTIYDKIIVKGPLTVEGLIA